MIPIAAPSIRTGKGHVCRTAEVITMEAARDEQVYGLEDGELCPECSHTWTLSGPAHFTDCRYFSLDDDRDEEPSVTQWVASYEMVIDRWQKVAA
jgi:hypothetical protein